MSPEDREYLTTLRDDLCARWGFTWRDVEQGERIRRMRDLSTRITVSTEKIAASMAALGRALRTIGPLPPAPESATDPSACVEGGGGL